MFYSRGLKFLSALAILRIAPHVLGLGHDDSMAVATTPELAGHWANATSPLENMTAPKMGQSYFTYPNDSQWIVAHIALMTMAWFFVLPIGVMLSVARSRLAALVQLSFLGMNGLALLFSAIYTSNTPNLYPGNSHHKMGWVLAWVVVVQSIMATVKLYADHTRSTTSHEYPKGAFSTPISTEAMAQHHRMHAAFEPVQHTYSDENAQGPTSETPRTNSMSGTTDFGEEYQHDFRNADDNDYENNPSEKRSLFGKRAYRFLSNKPNKILGKVMTVTNIMHKLIDISILPLGFVAMSTGIVVYGGIFRGPNVFNGVAHFIKGGIFFWYGLLTLGRWMGCFAEVGWAWNIKPPIAVVSSRKARMPSAEFVESFVIFLYGITNVFLEHLAAWGKAWAPMDLEHVSISIMFFGGGLCGMLVESKIIRDLLNTGLLSNRNLQLRDESWTPPKTYNFSMNPFPALVILLLGIMMSSHHQHSMVSTMVHRQWGTLFVGFALARAVTYILTYLSPPTSYLPSRPPSEIITSFCLISGGLIFMASNKDTVASMTQYDLDAMFVFTVTMGFTAFLMAWTILVLAIKGWATRRRQSSSMAHQTDVA